MTPGVHSTDASKMKAVLRPWTVPDMAQSQGTQLLWKMAPNPVTDDHPWKASLDGLIVISLSTLTAKGVVWQDVSTGGKGKGKTRPPQLTDAKWSEAVAAHKQSAPAAIQIVTQVRNSPALKLFCLCASPCSAI